jgi:hypothetical protein
MTGKLSATLRDLQRMLAEHAKTGMPMTAKDALTVSRTVGACATYAELMERKRGDQIIRSFTAHVSDPATWGFTKPKEADADAKVLRFPPRVRVVVTQSVAPPDGDSA